MNPFDLKTALLARHAQHVVIIHFPIALFMSSFAFDLLALWNGSRSLARAAYYNLIAAAVSAPAAVITGVLAWQLQLEGAKLRGNLACIWGSAPPPLFCFVCSRGGAGAMSGRASLVSRFRIGRSDSSPCWSLR